MKFLVDLPLGGLAKWLRFYGFDATGGRLAPDALPPPQPDTFILTRQQPLKRPGRPDVLVLAAAGPREQLAEVLALLKISRRQLKPLSRCSRCNEPLASVDRSRVRGRVPEHVFHHQSRFYECPRCRRLFWPGSHLKGITRTLLKKWGDD
jgi:uncharacterized protein with PIN domain